MKKNLSLILATLLLSAFIAACGGSSGGGGGGGGDGGGGGTTTPPQNPGGVWNGQSVTAAAADVSTSFEFSATGPFVDGTTPYTASYSSGAAQTVGNTALYHSGLFAWHIFDGSVATVTFETLPNTLSFWVRTANASVISNIDIFDDNGVLVLNVVPTSTYKQFNVAGATLIGSMVVTNAGGGDVVMDDLTFGYSGSGLPVRTDDISCIVSELMEVVCVILDVTTGDILVSVEATLQIANVTGVSGTGTLYAAPGSVLSDGSTVAPLTITVGTISEGNTLVLTVDGVGRTNDVSMVFDAIYNRGSALATVEAVYASINIFGDVLSFVIDATGVITGQSASCVLNGQVSISDANFNAYDVQLDASLCGGLDGMYNGLGITQDQAAGTDNAFLFVVTNALNAIAGAAIK